MDAPTHYTIPRQDPWYPNQTLTSSEPILTWLTSYMREWKDKGMRDTPVAALPLSQTHRPGRRCGVPYPDRILTDFMMTVSVSHPIRPGVPFYWCFDVHHAFRHASVIEMEYWELGPAGSTSAQLPANYTKGEIQHVCRRLAGFPTYVPDRTRILIQAEAQDGPLTSRIKYDPSLVRRSFAYTLVECPRDEEDKEDHGYATAAMVVMATQREVIRCIFDSGCNRILVHSSVKASNKTEGRPTKLAGITSDALQVSLRGSAHFDFIAGDGKTNEYTFHDALISKQTPYTILSPGVMDVDMNYSTVFQNGQGSYDGQQAVSQGRREGQAIGRQLALLSPRNGQVTPWMSCTPDRRERCNSLKFWVDPSKTKTTRAPYFKGNQYLDEEFKMGEALHVDFCGPWPTSTAPPMKGSIELQKQEQRQFVLMLTCQIQRFPSTKLVLEMLALAYQSVADTVVPPRTVVTLGTNPFFCLFGLVVRGTKVGAVLDNGYVGGTGSTDTSRLGATSSLSPD
eukprot:g55650.t1